MKFCGLVKETMKRLEKLWSVTLFPNINYSKEDRDVTLNIEEKTKLAWKHYKAIEKTDVIYFILPKGYMGTSCKIELGYALALKKLIYFSEPTNEIGLERCSEKYFSKTNLKEFEKELNQ